MSSFMTQRKQTASGDRNKVITVSNQEAGSTKDNPLESFSLFIDSVDDVEYKFSNQRSSSPVPSILFLCWCPLPLRIQPADVFLQLPSQQYDVSNAADAERCHLGLNWRDWAILFRYRQFWYLPDSTVLQVSTPDQVSMKAGRGTAEFVEDYARQCTTENLNHGGCNKLLFVVIISGNRTLCYP